MIVAVLLWLATAWLCLHWATDTPLFLLMAPSCILWLRFKALTGFLQSTSDNPLLQAYQMPAAAVKAVFQRTLYFCLSSLTVHEFLWMLDEILYPDYRRVSLENSVFVVASVRCGSTSLHRALSLDKERFVSPRFIELFWPFICVQKFLDWLELRDERLGTTVIKNLEAKFQAQLGPDVMARHPMHWHEAEEDDVLLASTHLVGWYLAAAFPHPEVWVQSGHVHRLPQSAQQRSFVLYERALQKILYRRGNGHHLLTKSHLISLVPTIADKIPGAKIVGMVRHPADAFVSLYGLTEASYKSLSPAEDYDPKALVAGHVRFWQEFTRSEMSFLKNKHMVVTLNDYVQDQDKVVHKLYDAWGYPIRGTEFEKRLEADRTKHKAYKAKANYKNPTLEELGLERKLFDEMFAEYLTTFGIVSN
ncbi:expressed unknown protein [Seminavis robusta]|uniref:Sulfotransferase n=1 Tax=Seminavis robusta TaxID=568900 RepID=A0A9N8DN76_9STRA|nr:expressed unknown protein [Seminavis robusta]|eukprot:Sro172_g075880.1 n/a (419) ;mRNA; f:8536-9792